MLTTNLEALRGLYVALGGNAADVADITTLPEMLEKISTVASAAASELPAVTSSDNGKALIVSSGKWQKGTVLPSVTSSNVGKVLAVDSNGKWAAQSNMAMVEATFEKNGDVFSVSSIGRTFADIRKMLQNGKQVVLSANMDSERTHFPNQCFQFASGVAFMNGVPNTTLNFHGIGVDNGDVYAVVVSIASDNTATMTAVKLSA